MDLVCPLAAPRASITGMDQAVKGKSFISKRTNSEGGLSIPLKLDLPCSPNSVERARRSKRVCRTWLSEGASITVFSVFHAAANHNYGIGISSHGLILNLDTNTIVHLPLPW